MTAAAFKATYSDWKLVKTRGVVQIVFEVPLAEADLAYKVVGGMPNAAAESWFGIAKLRDTNVAVSSSATGGTDASTTARESSVPPSKQRKPVAPEKRLAQQAGICCADPVFWRYLREAWDAPATTEALAAESVRALCCVNSRAEIIPGTKAGGIWEALYGQFLGWRDHDMPAQGAAA